MSANLGVDKRGFSQASELADIRTQILQLRSEVASAECGAALLVHLLAQHLASKGLLNTEAVAANVERVLSNFAGPQTPVTRMPAILIDLFRSTDAAMEAENA